MDQQASTLTAFTAPRGSLTSRLQPVMFFSHRAAPAVGLGAIGHPVTPHAQQAQRRRDTAGGAGERQGESSP
jgi:hypothetical protein